MSWRSGLSYLGGAFRDPGRLSDLVSRSPTLAADTIRRLLLRHNFGPEVPIAEREWDNLILLDCLRTDVFSTRNSMAGDFDVNFSRGSNSWQFMENNFVGRSFHDTVYVTGNPNVERLDEDVFYTVETVYEDWNDEHDTVMPETVVDWAIEANETYPDKRLIVHFMQPHYPHLGPTGQRLRDEYGLRGWDRYHGRQDKSALPPGQSVWEAARDGAISDDELFEAYSENAEIALEHAAELIERLDGMSVISADHGEMLGERPFLGLRKRYAHPRLYTPELRIVPWFTATFEGRRGTVSEPPIGYERHGEEEVNERLRALGYKT